VEVTEAFMSSSSPGNISNFHPNRYYPDEEQYLYAIADVMQREYEAIVDAGLLLQIDCPDLAIQGIYFPEATDEEFRKTVAMRIEALNYATRRIPPESMRMHVCWGRGEAARLYDQPLKNLIHEFLKARPTGLTIVGCNGRHEYEWQVWREVKLPADKVLIPGPSRLLQTGRPEGHAPANLCVFIVTHPEPQVQTALYRATLCCELLWQAPAACWGRRYRRERVAAVGEGREDAPGVFSGLRSRGAGAKMPFVCPSMLPPLSSPFAHFFSFLYSFL
jgi:hypothetical protein